MLLVPSNEAFELNASLRIFGLRAPATNEARNSTESTRLFRFGGSGSRCERERKHRFAARMTRTDGGPSLGGALDLALLS